MTELAKMIFTQSGSMILNKKQVAKLMGKSIGLWTRRYIKIDLKKPEIYKEKWRKQTWKN